MRLPNGLAEQRGIADDVAVDVAIDEEKVKGVGEGVGAGVGVGKDAADLGVLTQDESVKTASARLTAMAILVAIRRFWWANIIEPVCKPSSRHQDESQAAIPGNHWLARSRLARRR